MNADAYTTMLACGLQCEIIGQRIKDRQRELDQCPKMAYDSQQRLRRLIAKDIATVLELETKAGIR